MLMKASFEIPYGSINDNYHERVIKNAMVIDLLGNVAVFADLTPVSMVAIQTKIDDYGLLMSISETGQSDSIDDGHRVELTFSPDIHSKTATTEQTDILSALANLEIEDEEPIPTKLVTESFHAVPSLWYSEVAFTPSGLAYNAGPGWAFHEKYNYSLDYISNTIRDLQIQAHREFNASIRSHLSNKGYDMKQVPKPELDDDRKQQQLDEQDPKYSAILTKAQELQLFSTDLSKSKFAIRAAKDYIAHALKT
jgi:hypothetical protein